MTPTDNLEPITEEELNEARKIVEFSVKYSLQNIGDRVDLMAFLDACAKIIPRLLKGYGELQQRLKISDGVYKILQDARKVEVEMHKAQLAEKEQVIEKMKKALNEIANSGKISWTDMASPIEEELSDIRHAFNMQQYTARKCLEKVKNGN